MKEREKLGSSLAFKKHRSACASAISLLKLFSLMISRHGAISNIDFVYFVAELCNFHRYVENYIAKETVQKGDGEGRRS